MDLNRPVVALCMAGIHAEFERRLDDAREFYAQAWRSAADDYDKAIAGHYVAHLTTDPVEGLRWNQVALAHAERGDPEMVKELLPSLYVNLGRSFEQVGEEVESARYYALAASLDLVHQPE